MELEASNGVDPWLDLQAREKSITEKMSYEGLHLEYDKNGHPNKLVIAELGEGSSFIDTPVVWEGIAVPV